MWRIAPLRKFEHITIHRKKLDLLNMDERRSLHSLTLNMHKIVKQIAPAYLCTRINAMLTFIITEPETDLV